MAIKKLQDRNSAASSETLETSSPDVISRLEKENADLRLQLQVRIEAEEKLLHHKRQLDAIFDNAPVELYLKDREGRYLRINRQFEKIFGVRNEDVVGKLPDELHEETVAAATRQHDLDVLSSGEILSREVKTELVTDDRIHTLQTIKFPVFDAEGNIDGLGSIATDITDQKITEQRIYEMVNTLDGIVWEATPNSVDINYVSEQAERILGYPVSEWLEKEFWPRHIHPDDRQNVLDYFRQCYAEGLNTFELEYRFFARDGRIVWLRDLVSTRKENGEVVTVLGIMIDITEQKQSEQMMRMAEERFRTIFMAAPVGMALADTDTGHLIEANPAYTRIIGRSLKEMQQLSWQSVTHPDDLGADLNNMHRLVAGEISSYKMPKRFIRPDKSIVWTELTVTPMVSLDAQGNQQYLAIVDDISERKVFEERIWQQANYDLLTGLPNRNMLQDRLSQLILKEKRDGMGFALLLIDLDEFKDVNDTLGHDRGDELLVMAAKRIHHCLRESDTVARLGGDEFVIILSELSLLSGVEQVAQNVLKALSEPFLLGEESAYISASIGITLYPDDAENMVSLIKNADQAMYVAKAQGRNCYHFFTQSMQLAALTRMQLVNDLRFAVAQNQFLLYYQPIVELATGKVHKAEALIRWQHPSRGMVNPVEFITIAEETRMIKEIGDWVFLEAARQAKNWRSTLGETFQISINASPIQFEDPLQIAWGNYLDKLELDAGAISVEITENLLMSSDDSIVDTLLAFRDAGTQVALDDFGTGYSSLSYLTRFDIDYLKIDQSFVQNLSPQSDDLALCAAIVVMAHKLGIAVIAEGIETEAQKELLMSIDCDYGQGYLFAQPMSAQTFEQQYGEAD